MSPWALLIYLPVRQYMSRNHIRTESKCTVGLVLQAMVYKQQPK